MSFSSKPRIKVRELSLFEFTRKNDSPDPSASLQDLFTLLDWKQQDPQQQKQILSEKPHLRFYTDQKGALKLFHEEIDEQVNQQTNLTNAVILAAASSSLNRLKRLAEECNLTNDLLETLISKEDWAECSNKAKEFENSKNYLRAAAYYFCCFESKAGIKCLMEAQHYRDAVLTARLRLSPADSLILDATTEWAAKFLAENCFEAAAKCYLAINQPMVASEVLVKRETLPVYRARLRLIIISGAENLSLASQWARVILVKALTEHEWSAVPEVIDLCPEHEFWRYLSNMHQAICYILSQHNVCLAKPPLKIELKRFSSAIRHFTQENFMRNIWNLWLDGGLDPNIESAVEKAIERLDQERISDLSMFSTENKDLPKRLPFVAVEMTLGLLHLSKDPTAAENYFKNACEMLNPYKTACKILRSVVNAPALSDDTVNTSAAQDELAVEVTTTTIVTPSAADEPRLVNTTDGNDDAATTADDATAANGATLATSNDTTAANDATLANGATPPATANGAATAAANCGGESTDLNETQQIGNNDIVEENTTTCRLEQDDDENDPLSHNSRNEPITND